MIEAGPHVLLVFPKFNGKTFWSADDLCAIMGARCPAPPLGLLTLAALLPPSWTARLVDRNAEELTEADLDWADLVLTGGMFPQQPDTLVLIETCRARGLPVCVGGPAATSSPHVFARADFLVLGEAEGVIDAFIAAWECGERSGRFEGPKFQADVTRSPIPRFDLLTFSHYLQVGVQFSRGCPFTCEFCDIIELYGRVPRTKTVPQMLAELDRLLELGYRGHVDFVDDNLIGNKKAVKAFLPALHAWQKAHGTPFRFSTEASINLADDPELLGMMRAANFFAVFVGIESPDPETLIHTQKKQNTRRDIADSIHRINAAGLFVMGGFIVGFDTERPPFTDAMVDLIERANIPLSLVGLLTALPNTQLTRRLDREGRLHIGYDEVTPDVADQCMSGLNFLTLRERRDVLADYREVLTRVYDPALFFGRVSRLADRLGRRPVFGPASELPRGVQARLFGRLAWHMTVMQPRLARHFWPTLVACARKTGPGGLFMLIVNMALFLYLHRFSKRVVATLDATIADMDAGRWRPTPVRGPAAIPALSSAAG